MILIKGSPQSVSISLKMFSFSNRHNNLRKSLVEADFKIKNFPGGFRSAQSVNVISLTLPLATTTFL